jgi:hypothetical protein
MTDCKIKDKSLMMEIISKMMILLLKKRFSIIIFKEVLGVMALDQHSEKRR